jgi:hypothetical protein
VQDGAWSATAAVMKQHRADEANVVFVSGRCERKLCEGKNKLEWFCVLRRAVGDLCTSVDAAHGFAVPPLNVLW